MLLRGQGEICVHHVEFDNPQDLMVSKKCLVLSWCQLSPIYITVCDVYLRYLLS